MSDREEIARLAVAVSLARTSYYEGRPEVSDAEYDRLEERLRRLAPNHPVLAEVGGPRGV